MWVPQQHQFSVVSGNGDDNLILGLCVDKVSQDESIVLTLGDEEKEVSPCCILLCVTVDGKLSMFHFFRYLSMIVYFYILILFLSKMLCNLFTHAE